MYTMYSLNLMIYQIFVSVLHRTELFENVQVYFVRDIVFSWFKTYNVLVSDSFRTVTRPRL